MKQEKHIKEAAQIGDGSFDLMNYEVLPKNASKQRQADALRADQKWLRDHCDETCRAIDYLIQDIDNS